MSSSDLTLLSRDELLDLAENKQTPIATLLALVQNNPDDTELSATIMIAVDQRTSVYDKIQGADEKLADLLDLLSSCADMSVRWGVAKNIHTDPQTLTKLSNDDINLVRALVATNPSTPAHLLTRLFNDEKIVRDGLSGNPSTPEKYLRLLSDDADRMVRLRVADNPSAPDDLLVKLTQDPDADVAKAAMINKEKRA